MSYPRFRIRGVSTLIDSIESAVPSGLTELPTERLEAELTTFASHLAAGTCRWLLMVAEYDRRRAYEQWDCVSMEQWLSIHVSLSPSAARAHVTVARRLGELPLVCAAFGEGRLSYSKVRALCRVACAENEADWLVTALHASASQLERITADTRRVLIAAQHGTAAAQDDQRRLSCGWTDGGMLRIDGLLPPEVGAVLVRLLAEQRDLLEPDPDATLTARNVDAFASLLDLAGAAYPSVDGEGERRALIVVHREIDGTCRLEGGPPIPVDVAEQLACDADHLTATHTTDGISLGRRQRFPSASLRRHVVRRDRHCVIPGCGRTRNLHVHHIVAYCDNGETTKENLVLLCSSHHGSVHRRGWTISGDPETGTLVFTLPGGRTLTPSACVGDADELVRMNRSCGVNPTRRTVSAQSLGERYDHGLAVVAFTNNRPVINYPTPTRHRTPPTNSPAPPDRSASAEANESPHPLPSNAFVFDENDNLISVPTHYDWP